MRIKIVESYIDNQLKDTILKDTIIEVSKKRAKELISKGIAVIDEIKEDLNANEIKIEAVENNKKDEIEDEES